jgi:hypothetical protein
MSYSSFLGILWRGTRAVYTFLQTIFTFEYGSETPQRHCHSARVDVCG